MYKRKKKKKRNEKNKFQKSVLPAHAFTDVRAGGFIYTITASISIVFGRLLRKMQILQCNCPLASKMLTLYLLFIFVKIFSTIFI